MLKPQYYLAIDIGASSGRHIIGYVEDRTIKIQEVYRFPNQPVIKNGHLCWDIEALLDHVIKGLSMCMEIGCVPKTIGIDTWGVDFALLDKNDTMIGDVVAYRDKRTEGADAETEHLISFSDLYARTGIQKQPFNTIYQLAAIKRDAPEELKKAESLLMMPDYLGFLLTGVKRQEYTNATTTALVHAETRRWDTELIGVLDLPEKLFGDLSMPNTVVGDLKNEIADQVGFNCTVILPATHDTGSAFIAVPANDENSVYISSGTWSLLGVENDRPILSEQSLKANFTNEGGFDDRFRYLKNIMGLWMVQSIHKELTDEFTFTELSQLAKKAKYFKSLINVNDEAFLAPKNMLEAVRSKCAETNQSVPRTTDEVLCVIYRSLAHSYAAAIKELSNITGREYKSIHIVGGGCRDEHLNQLTADVAGLPVFAGPTEATALGNLVAQMIASGEFLDTKEARAAIRRSFEIKQYRPEGDSE